MPPGRSSHIHRGALDRKRGRGGPQPHATPRGTHKGCPEGIKTKGRQPLSNAERRLRRLRREQREEHAEAASEHDRGAAIHHVGHLLLIRLHLLVEGEGATVVLELPALPANERRARTREDGDER